MATNKRDVTRLPHHAALELCTTRPQYRQGRKLTAVKVYTVNSESQHLLVCGVPSLGLQDELRRLCARFGDVKSLVFVPNYAEEKFTDVYHVQYSRIQSARYAKRNLDDRAFYGGILSVCYAPEMESVAETRAKLVQRRKDIAIRTRGEVASWTLQGKGEGIFQQQQYHCRKKHSALPITGESVAQAGSAIEGSCIWQGVPCSVDPRKIEPAPELLEPTRVYGPQRADDYWALAGVRERRIVSECSRTRHTPTATSSLVPPNNLSSVLRFIPRQVSRKSQIVFHSTASSGGRVTDDKTPLLKRSLKRMESSDVSIDASIVEIHKKIRMDSVPSVQLTNREDPLAAK
ncbi:uncharacterized protein LOC111867731 [Cryptotermes secundus]|uniref:uncharacterized protein LOC111867731 n=1 Tax=Cryptotermes secundus TaxID=105785 RepID=UPI000CD7B56A|nr:uncharacterized protein LOC111867731 [Cryptotermes secundus]